MKKLCVAAVGFVLLALCAAAGAQQPVLEGLPVTSITVSPTRVSSAVILDCVPMLRTGVVWTAALEAEAEKALHRLGVFRQLDIVPKSDGAGGVAVEICASDSWYVLPLPLFTSGSGGSKFSLIILSGNLFHRAETIFLNGSVGRDTSGAGVGLKLGKYFFSANAGRDNESESLYSDGAYNTFAAKTKPEKFGQPVNAYNRKTDRWNLSFGLETSSNSQLGLSFGQANTSFGPATAFAPAGTSLYNTLGARYSFTVERNGGLSRTGGGSFGAIFGMGLSDLNQRIVPRADIGGAHTFEIQAAGAGAYTSSSDDFSVLVLSARNVWEFQERDRFSLNLSGAKGWNLPFTQLIPTGASTGLAGQYAREWRGDRGAGANISFTHLLSRSRRGQLVAEPFLAQSWVWNGDACHYQTGAGLNFYYRFWRFPLPLGLGMTYSLPDRDVVFSFTAGMGFGRDNSR